MLLCGRFSGRRRWPQGFSYVEMIISVAMLALLATAATPYLENTIKRQKEAELRRSLREIRSAIDAYKRAYDEGKMTKVVGESGYPKTLEALTEGVVDITDPQKRKLRFLRKLPPDPMFAGEAAKAEITWGKRAYDSDSENPREGLDVFDVYSLSDEKGMNGIPYRQW